MAARELVNGDGWISDESDFYGNEVIKSGLELKAKRRLEQPYNPFADVLAKRIKLESKSEPKNESVVDFLKSRPQIATLEKSAKKGRNAAGLRTDRTSNGNEAADLLYGHHSKGHPAAWQENETIDDFLKRLPVEDPSTAEKGPWLWVGNPQIIPNRVEKAGEEDIAAFIEAGEELQKAFLQQKSKMELANPDKAPATITRDMRTYRDQLEQDLLRTAIDKGITCGKWMLFPGSSNLPRYWRLVAEATSQGKLGPVSKVGTYDPYDGKDETLICVYTYDFTDLDDVRRVLDELLDLGLCTKDGKPLYYKSDAYTYLDIKSDNSYKLRASLFSSKDIFANEAKVWQDSPIARLKKRNKTVDRFFST